MNSDNHNHVIYGNIVSMVSSVEEKKIDRFSITEHISQFREPRSQFKFGSVHTTGRVFSGFEEYFEEFELLHDKFGHGIDISKGLEVDYSPRYEKELSTYVNQRKWDLLLYSVHELHNGMDIESRIHPKDRKSSLARWSEYLNLQKDVLGSEAIPFQVLAHPTRLARSSPIFPEDLGDQLCELATIAKKAHKALELNGNDIMRDYAFVEKLANACSRSNCKVSFGSDSHHPNEVGRGAKEAREFITKFKLTQIA